MAFQGRRIRNSSTALKDHRADNLPLCSNSVNAKMHAISGLDRKFAIVTRSVSEDVANSLANASGYDHGR